MRMKFAVHTGESVTVPLWGTFIGEPVVAEGSHQRVQLSLWMKQGRNPGAVSVPPGLFLVVAGAAALGRSRFQSGTQRMMSWAPVS